MAGWDPDELDQYEDVDWSRLESVNLRKDQLLREWSGRTKSTLDLSPSSSAAGSTAASPLSDRSSSTALSWQDLSQIHQTVIQVRAAAAPAAAAAAALPAQSERREISALTNPQDQQDERRKDQPLQEEQLRQANLGLLRSPAASSVSAQSIQDQDVLGLIAPRFQRQKSFAAQETARRVKPRSANQKRK